MYCVYMHVTPSDKVYIGLTGNDPRTRWANGKGYSGNKHFKNAIKKYGWENIQHVIIADNLTKEEACELEIKLIKKYNATNPEKGYNIALGGQTSMLGRHHSEPTKHKMSIKASEREYSQEYREKISEQKKKQYQEDSNFRANVMEALNKARNADHSWTDEHKQKFHVARVGHVVSKETREKLRKAHIGLKHDDETKRKIAQSQQKRVVCLETGAIYDSILVAAEQLNIKAPWLGEICRKKKGTACDLHFCFEIDLLLNDAASREQMISFIENNRKKKSKRQVLCVETGEIFESVTCAAKYVGVSRKCIEKVCKTKGTAAKYHWKYID